MQPVKTIRSGLVFTLSIVAVLTHPSLAFAQDKTGNQTPPQSIEKAIEAKDALFAKDPIPKMAQYLIDEGHADETTITALQTVAQRRVDDAIAFARESEYAVEVEAMARVFA